MNRSRALAFLVGGVLLVGAAMTARTLLAPRTSAIPSTTTTGRDYPSNPAGIRVSTPTTTPLSGTDVATLARVQVSLVSGPTVANGSDPLVSTPSARELNLLPRLPLDWPSAFLTATNAIEALGGTEPSRSRALQPAVSTDLYVAWTNAVAKQPGYSFRLNRLSLGSQLKSADAIPLAGVGVLSKGTNRSQYLVIATATRTNGSWLISSATFTYLGDL